MQEASSRSGIYISLVVATWIVLLLTFFFNGMASVDPSSNLGLYTSTTGDVSDVFYLEITPAGWTFSIWGFIYTYQVIWMVYATANIFRKSSNGVPLYKVAPVIHWGIFVSYIINLISNVSWLLLWDRKYIVASLFPIALTPVTMYICGAVSVWSIFRQYPQLTENGFFIENRLVIGLVSNAFAMYGTWVSVATLLNLGMVLVYSAGMAQAAGSSVALSILTFDILVWALLDLAFIEKYTRFLFTPHLVLMVALGGSISKNFNPSKPNSVFTVFLLIAVIITLLVKICLVTYREIKKPSFPEKSKILAVDA